MRIECGVREFREKLAFAARFRAPRSPIVAQQGVLIEVAEDAVLLKATDGFRGVVAAVPGCQVHEPGRAVLPSEVAQDIFRLADPDLLEIRDDPGSNGVVISGPKATWDCCAAKVEEFPEVPGPGRNVTWIGARARDLAGAVALTVFCSDRKPAKGIYALWATKLFVLGGEVVIGATDGRRSAEAVFPADLEDPAGAEGAEVLLPRQLGALIRELAAIDPDSRVEVGIETGPTASKVWARRLGTTLFTAGVAGRFPAYDRGFPAWDYEPAVVSTEALARDLRAAAVGLHDDDTTTRVRLSVAPGGIELATPGARVLHGCGVPDGFAGSVEVPIASLQDAVGAAAEAGLEAVEVRFGTYPDPLFITGQGWRYAQQPLLAEDRGKPTKNRKAVKA